MPWTKRHSLYASVRALLPPLNFTMGVFVGDGNLVVAFAFLLTYLALQAMGDFLFWGLQDATAQFTRKKLEAHIGGDER